MNERGFTLVELLVVLAVGAILLAIAIPSYAFLVNTNRLAAATNALVSSLQLARSEAIKRAYPSNGLQKQQRNGCSAIV